MSSFAVWMLLLLCSTIYICQIRGAVIKSSVTSIGTRLVVQSLTDHDGKNCHQSCAEIGSICNFAGIHMISLSEMKSLILEMLPNKKCFQLSSTLVDNQYKTHNEIYDPLFNVENSCTGGFEHIGYTKAYPVCETQGTYQYARICQCGNHNISASMTSIGTRLIAQDFNTSSQKDCTKTCEEAGMECDFDDFGSITLNDWKTIIRNVLPREVCHSYYADSPSVLVADGWKNYNNAMDPRFNKWNNCASGYLTTAGTSEPQCSGTGSTQHARICQCKTASASPTTFECPSGWKAVGDYACYFIDPNVQKKYDEAKSYCKDLNALAILPAFDNQDEVDDFKPYYQSKFVGQFNLNIWVNGKSSKHYNAQGTECDMEFSKPYDMSDCAIQSSATLDIYKQDCAYPFNVACQIRKNDICG